jgi:hypothetical protein
MYTNKNKTLQTIEYILFILRKGQEWEDVYGHFIEANLIAAAGKVVAFEEVDINKNPNSCDAFPQNLGRDDIPHILWTVRCALSEVAPQNTEDIHKWLFSSARNKKEVIDLLLHAQNITKSKIDEIPDLFGEGPNRPILVLHRNADKDGRKLCAMSALSKKLGYKELTDIPKEVDPGLSALVNLLNDRANNRARQLLIWRLEYLPNIDNPKICSLIADIFFPQIFSVNEYELECRAAYDCKGKRAKISVYSDLGERFSRPDGSGYLAVGCITMAAALKSKNSTTQNILAVAAASQVVSYETGEGWFDLLYILDFILGLEDGPNMGPIQSMSDFYKYFGEENDATNSSQTSIPLEPF